MARTDPHARRTSELVDRLAREAGAGPRARGVPFGWAVILGAALSLLAAVLVVAGVFGVRGDLASLPARAIFQFKVLAMGLLACAGILAVGAAGRPGSRLRWWVLAPGVLLLLVGAWVDRSGLPITGARTVSVPVCLAAIIVAAVPGLAILLAVLRRGIPTRPRVAGAAAGLLAGGLGAMAYTLACVNDGAAFVALWYSAAILATSLLGAMLGRRALAW